MFHQMIPEMLALQWHQFCHTTGIRGFLFLSKSDNKYERCLWILALVVSFALTVHDVTDTLRLYVEAPTTVRLSMVSNNVFNMSNMTICYALDHSQFLMANKNSNFNFTTEYFEEISNQLKQFDNLTELDYDNIYNAIYFVSKLMQFELNDDCNGSAAVQDNLAHVPVRLYNSTAIARKLGVIFWSALYLQVSNFINSSLQWTLLDHSTESQISWFGHSPFANHIESCVSLSPEALSFVSFGANLNVKFGKSEMFPSMFSSISVHLTPDPVMSYDIPVLAILALGYNHRIHVNLIGEYRSLPSKRDNCMEADSVVECNLHCRQIFIEAECGCRTIFTVFTEYQSSKQVCDIYQLKSAKDLFKQGCFNLTERKIRYRRCISSVCPRPCKTKIHSIQLSSTKRADNDTQMSVIAKVLVYPVFQEIYSFGVKQLLAQLGGNLSLWLGASFLVLLHMAVSAAKCFCRQEAKAEMCKDDTTSKVIMK